MNHVAQKRIDHVEQQMERRRAKAAEFDLPVDEPPLPVQEPKEKTGKKPMRPDVFVEESRKQQRQEAGREASDGPDILAVRPENPAQVEVPEQEELPKKLPPLNLDELRREEPPLVVPNRTRPEEAADSQEEEPEKPVFTPHPGSARPHFSRARGCVFIGGQRGK